MQNNTNKPYSELLRSPNWQKKRLEVMQRDDFQCQGCGERDVTLNVHHKYYTYGKSPWEYSDACYITYCEDCHAAQASAKESRLMLNEVIKTKGFSGGDYRELAQALQNCQEDASIITVVLAFVLSNQEAFNAAFDRAFKP